MQFSSSDACYRENGSVIAFILPNYPWKRSFEEVGDSTKDKYTKGVNNFDAVPRGLRKSYGVLLCCAYYTSQRHCSAADYVRVAATVVQL